MEPETLYTGKGIPGDLSDPNNWAGGIVPGDNSFAEITMNVGAPISGTYEVGNIMLLGSEQITFTGTLDTTGALSLCYGLYVCVGAGATFAPGAVLNDAGVLVVGQGAPGTFLAEGSGSEHSVINSVVGKLGNLAGGVGTVTISDGIWNNTGELLLGNYGEGTLNVINGGSVNIGGGTWMAGEAGSSASMNISSGGSVNFNEFLLVGNVGPTAVATVNVGSGGNLTVNQELFVDGGSKLVLAGGTVTGGVKSGNVDTLTGGVITGFGTLNTQGIVDAGTIVATGGTLDITGRVLGAGSIQIAANSTAVINAANINIPSIAFIGSNATLGLEYGSSVSATISGFGLGDMITMAGITSASLNPSNGMLKLMNNNALVEFLHLAGSFTGDTFAVHQAGGLSTITLQHS